MYETVQDMRDTAREHMDEDIAYIARSVPKITREERGELRIQLARRVLTNIMDSARRALGELDTIETLDLLLRTAERDPRDGRMG